MRPKILVVDDERAILDTVEILLRGEGFDASVAQSGREALERFDDIAPDIVVTDIRMPGVTGLDLLEAVRQRDPEIPVILMTAQASLQSAVKAVNQGAFYYLQKPFSNAELVALCRRAGQMRELSRENKTLKREIRRRDSSQTVRQKPLIPRSAQVGGNGCAHRVDDPAYRRERHRQGSRRPLHPSALRA